MSERKKNEGVESILDCPPASAHWATQCDCPPGVSCRCGFGAPMPYPTATVGPFRKRGIRDPPEDRPADRVELGLTCAVTMGAFTGYLAAARREL